MGGTRLVLAVRLMSCSPKTVTVPAAQRRAWLTEFDGDGDHLVGQQATGTVIPR